MKIAAALIKVLNWSVIGKGWPSNDFIFSSINKIFLNSLSGETRIKLHKLYPGVKT